MAVLVVGTCQFCGVEIKADDKRDAATLPVLQRAAKLGRLTCKPCVAKGVTEVDRDNPPDIKNVGIH